MLCLMSSVFAAENAVTAGADDADKYVNEPVPQDAVLIMRVPLGSGTPGYADSEPATYVGDGLWHAPQYMAAFPTAGEIWPRVLTVQCELVNMRYVCDGYDWLPSMGRGEYLFIKPLVKRHVTPVIVPGPERIIIKEVPVKKKMQ